MNMLSLEKHTCPVCKGTGRQREDDTFACAHCCTSDGTPYERKHPFYNAIIEMFRVNTQEELDNARIILRHIAEKESLFYVRSERERAITGGDDYFESGAWTDEEKERLKILVKKLPLDDIVFLMKRRSHQVFEQMEALHLMHFYKVYGKREDTTDEL